LRLPKPLRSAQEGRQHSLQLRTRYRRVDGVPGSINLAQPSIHLEQMRALPFATGSGITMTKD
jgi:hypothetical protein